MKQLRQLKRWLVLQVFAGVFALGLASQAQAQAPVPIPVIDAPSLTEQIAHGVAVAGNWATQIAKMQLQYEMLVNAYNAVTNARHITDIFDNPAIRAFLPLEWGQIYDDIRTMGYRARYNAAQEIADANRAFDTCEKIKDEEKKTTCEALAMQAALKKGLMVPAIQMVTKRGLHIRELEKAMRETQDMKEAAELQGQISAEQAYMLNMQAEMLTYDIESETERELLEQRATEQEVETFAKPGGIIPAPLRFD